MGNISTEEKIGITIIAIIVGPFYLLGNALKSLAQSIGLIPKDKEIEYDPTLDPNSPDYQSNENNIS
jgi:hypothetical protein